MKTPFLVLIISVLAFATANAATEQEVVNQSAAILRDFRRMPQLEVGET